MSQRDSSSRRGTGLAINFAGEPLLETPALPTHPPVVVPHKLVFDKGFARRLRLATPNNRGFGELEDVGRHLLADVLNTTG